MRLIKFTVAFVFLGVCLHAGVMPEEAPRAAAETITSLNDQKVDYSSDLLKVGTTIKEKFEDFMNFAFMAIFLII